MLVLPLGARVFCKGTHVDNPALRMFRLEARVGPVLPACAPHLLWQVEAAGWLMLGFEHVDGRHANLSPGSPDILLVIDALVESARVLTPSPVDTVPTLAQVIERIHPWQALRDHPPAGLDTWTSGNLAMFATQEAAALDMVSGQTLAHTDIHELNLLIDRKAHITDWAWAKLAAPWVDMSHLVIRLIGAGHTPEQAEDLVSRAVLWRDAPASAVTAFAVEIYGMWEYLRHVDPRPIREGPTRAARTWAMYRTSSL